VTRPVRLLSLALVAAAAVALPVGSAGAALPSGGVVAEGVGPPGITVGSPATPLVRRLHLVCLKPAPGNRARRCYTSLRHGLNYIQIDGSDRIEAVVFNEGAFRTRRGVGVGSRISAVEAAYGKRLSVRSNPTWTYIDLHQTIRGQKRVTSFLGRTKIGDIVQLFVARERRHLVKARLTPAGLQVSLTDFDPRVRFEISVSPSWGRITDDTEVGAVKVGDDGKATVTIPLTTPELARLIAIRPDGITSPITLNVFVEGFRRVMARVPVPLPAPPTMTIDRAVVSADVPGTLTITGLEPQGGYVVAAAWSCPAGPRGSEDPATVDDLPIATGAPVTAVLDVQQIEGGLFSFECAGDTPPATLPATLTLYRFGRRPGGRDVREKVATLDVTVARSP
jgi:hypothetical protein